MSRNVVSADLHLGHKGICKYRTQFKTPEEHDAYVLSQHYATIKPNDTWYCFGDVAFTLEALMKIRAIPCKRKVLLMGNHDLERGDVTMLDLLGVFDEVLCLKAHKAFGVNMWFSHCPIHPAEMRGKQLNIHGHLHDKLIDDPHYVNVCVEHTGYGVVPLEDVVNERMKLIAKLEK